MRGYIAMLATQQSYRGHGIATKLVRMAVDKMIDENADEVFPKCPPHTSTLWTREPKSLT